MTRDEFVEDVTAAHARLVALVERIDDATLGQSASNGWTGKDLLAHLAWWQEHSARVVEDLRAGRRPDAEADPAATTDEINERVYRAHLDDPPQVSRTALTQSYHRLAAAVSLLSDDELFAVDHWPGLDGEPLAEMLLWDTSRHYDAHRGDLATLVDPPSAGSGGSGP